MPARRTSRAPKGVDRQAVALAALELVAAEGEAGFSLRRLGDALDLDPMTLLHHFGSREGLLRAAADRFLAELPLATPAGEWRADLRGFAQAFRALARRRPRAVELLWNFGATGKADYRHSERVYGSMLGAGLPDARAAELGVAFYVLVIGLCVAESRGLVQPSSAAEREELGALSPAAHAAQRRLASEFAALSPESTFMHAVEAYLAGIAALVPPRRRRAAGARAPQAAAGPGSGPRRRPG
ncbi:MAG: TetR/AcrR family transcriptional regulator C-terminal domain-containing protein [Pseudomonadota bacterium]